MASCYFLPVIIEFSRCVGTYSSGKFELTLYLRCRKDALKMHARYKLKLIYNCKSAILYMFLLDICRYIISEGC